MVDWARLENEKSGMTRRFESYPTRRRGENEEGKETEVVAEWLNATDCNFVPITVRRFKSFPPQEGRRRRKKAKKQRRMNGRTQEQAKKRRKAKTVEKPMKRGEGNRRRRRKRRKRNHPQYVRGVPRRPARTLEKGLRNVYGLGRVKAREVCRACGRRPTVKVGNLEQDHFQLMEGWRRENVRCSSDRRRKEFESIQRQLKLGTHRGIQMRRGLPVRGQRTSTNGMTARRVNKQRGTKVTK